MLAPLVASGMPSELARRLFVACDVRGRGLLGLDDFLGALTVITAGRPDERAALLFYCIAGAAGTMVRDREFGQPCAFVRVPSVHRMLSQISTTELASTIALVLGSTSSRVHFSVARSVMFDLTGNPNAEAASKTSWVKWAVERGESG